eukprot:NODE_570_length_5905_cov_0.420944.p6 type:complete len:107 gc:universal NODE_570_length_5905_cov_0.420944:3547-3227(-)
MSTLYKPIIGLIQANNIQCKAIIIERVKGGTFLIADSTGSIFVDIPYKFAEYLEIGDIIELKGFDCKQMNDAVRLRYNDLSIVYKIGEFCMMYKATPNRSLPINSN